MEIINFLTKISLGFSITFLMMIEIPEEATLAEMNMVYLPTILIVFISAFFVNITKTRRNSYVF